MVWFKGYIMESPAQTNIPWSIIVSKNFLKVLFIYLRERERGQAVGKGEAESGLPTEQGDQFGAPSQNLEHDPSWRQMLNWLSHPNALRMPKILNNHSFIYSRNITGSVFPSWDIAVFESHFIWGHRASCGTKCQEENDNGQGESGAVECVAFQIGQLRKLMLGRWHFSRGLNEVGKEALQMVFKSLLKISHWAESDSDLLAV